MIYYSNGKVKVISAILKVSNGAKIRNRYNQVPHLSLHFNQQIICNYCAKYKHTSSMNERGVCIMSRVTNSKNIFDFDP